MSPTSNVTKSARRQAIEWLIARSAGNWTATDEAALRHWLESDPEHQQEFDRAQSFLQQVGQFKARDFPQRQAARSYRAPTRKRWQTIGASLALAATFVIAIVAWRAVELGEAHYRTAKGEQMKVDLADGSQIRLNTDTELSVRNLFGYRRAHLVRGQALFNINHNPDHPFEVKTASGSIQDIGTRFDVHAASDRVDVTVFEGSVDISTERYAAPMPLAPGQTASISTDGYLSTPAEADIAAALAWQRGKLIFKDQPLPAVMAEIQRYHDIDVQYDGKGYDEVRVSGTFAAADLPLFLKTLEAGFPVKAELIDSRHLLLHRLTTPTKS